MDYKLPKLPSRAENSNKGTFGKVLNVAGSRYMRGCAYLCSYASLKIGAGYSVLASEECVLDTVSKLAPEIVLLPTDQIIETLSQVDVLAIGCGLSTNNKKIFLDTLNARNSLYSIIDADGLNILSENYLKLDKKVILTPHPKEASRLLNCTLEEILNDTVLKAKEICEKYNCITVLKTHNTVVTDGEKFYVNEYADSALAKAGSGDVLCGMIAGLAAQKMNIFEAAALGVYLHSLTGSLARKDLSEYGVMATDLLKYIPFAVKAYLSEKSQN